MQEIKQLTCLLTQENQFMTLLKKLEKKAQIYLTKLFTDMSLSDTQKSVYGQEREESVYDIVNAGSNHRFAVLGDNGWVVAHNCDYGSQEVFIAGSISGDKNLKNAYSSADVYMYYAQLTGMYPKDLPIPTEDQRSEEWFKPYKKVRSISKTLNLSMQFGAGAKAVAAAVRDATKDLSITDEQGYKWVEEYHDAYEDYYFLTKEIKDFYTGKKVSDKMGIMLVDGWRMGTDNPSPLSAGNLPIQGLGSVILREACKMLDDAGIYVIATLHDAVTVYCKEEEADEIGKQTSLIMQEAAKKILGEYGMKVGHPEILKHGELWLHSEKAQAHWAKLKSHFGY